MAKRKKQPRKRMTTKQVQATEALPPPLPKVEVKPELDTDPLGEDGLTVRQRSFVEALIGPAGGNASKAAEMAGYAADNNNALRVTASRLLTKANVQEAIAHAAAKRRMTAEWAIGAITDLAGASMANFLSVGDDGQPTCDWKKAAAAGALGHIREYKEDGFEDSTGPVIIKRSFKLFDRQKAIETVLKMRGLLKDTVKHEGGVQITHDSSAAIKKLMADPDAFEAAVQLADRMAALESNDHNGHNGGDQPEPGSN